MIRIVLDTNVIVSGLLWNGAPSRLLAAAYDAEIELVSSWAILDELLEVLARPKLTARLSALDADPAILTFDFLTQCLIVTPVPIERTASDPKDDMVLGTALAAQAEFIVTGDKPLLGLQNIAETKLMTVDAMLDELQRR